MNCSINKCTCEHTFQDNKYGPKMRICNPAPKAGGARCTVCGKIHKK